MTISYQYLEGPFEDPAETIRKLIHAKWEPINTNFVTPLMYSPLGVDGQLSSIVTKDELGHADWNKPRTGNFITFISTNTEDLDTDSRTNDYIRKNIIVSIDVYATNHYRLMLFMEELENIIFENLPNTSPETRLRKSLQPTQNSAIATFGNQSLVWTTIGSIFEAGIIKGKNTTLKCTIEKFKS